MRRKNLKRFDKHCMKDMKQKLKMADLEIKRKEKKIETLRCMTRTFWERWKWELEKRKEALWLSRTSNYRQQSTEVKPYISEIDPSLLTNPIVNDKQTESYLGRGAFGIVKLMVYRAMYVAVKQLHVKALLGDVQREAELTASLCHPFFPYIYGICSKVRPYSIVLQFHGFIGSTQGQLSHTLHREIERCQLNLTCIDWITVCAQILEAIDYLHSKAEVLHYDITTTNILLGPPTTYSQQHSSAGITGAGNYQIVIVDFGKATKLKDGRMFRLSIEEKLDYQKKFPHVAPEVVEGEYRQSIYSDMYGVGGVLYQLVETGRISNKSYQKILLNIAEDCRLINYFNRISASRALLRLQELVVP